MRVMPELKISAGVVWVRKTDTFKAVKEQRCAFSVRKRTWTKTKREPGSCGRRAADEPSQMRNSMSFGTLRDLPRAMPARWPPVSGKSPSSQRYLESCRGRVY